MKRNKTKRLTFKNSVLSVITVAVLLVGNTVACGSGGNSESESGSFLNPPETIAAKVWTATGIEKILRDTDYSDRYNDKVLEISAFRNECESGQILITPEKDAEYSVELSPLYSSDGNSLSSDSFTVYHQKYIEVTNVDETYFTYGKGYYPDALLPYETAVQYGENKVYAGKNQGVWLTLKPSKNQKAGKYTGNFKISLNETEYSVPVTVNVFDYTLSDENHQKTRFTVSDLDLAVSELDDTREMHETYTEFFLDYRISTTLAYESTYSNDISGYVAEAVRLAKDIRCNSISLPYKQLTVKTEVDGDGKIAIDDERGQSGNKTEDIQTADWVAMEVMYFAVASACFNEDVNVFEKIDCFFTFLDEYDQTPSVYRRNLNRVIYNLRRQVDFVENFAKIIGGATLQNGNVVFSSALAFDDANANAGIGYSLVAKKSSYSGCKLSSARFNELKNEMKSACEKIRTVITAAGINDEYAEYTDSSFCPGPKYYYRYGEGLPYKAFDYAEKNPNAEQWCYTCAGPNNGYPSYHIDDNLISARLLNWEMYENDIVGNMFWECVLSRNVDLTDQNLSSQLGSQDYYSDAERFPGTNGDGFLVYPGRQYGIKGPVGSIRLQAIRDGIEDYELLYALEQKYAEYGADGEKFDNVYKFITEKLTRNGVCNYGSDYVENFLSCRQLLADLLVAADKTDTVISNCELNGSKAVITVTSGTATTVKRDGKVLSGSKKNGYVEYSITLDLTQSVSEFGVVAEKGGVVCEIKFPIGSAKTITTNQLFEKVEVTSNASHVGEKSATDFGGEKTLLLKCNAQGSKQAVLEVDVSDFKFDYYSNRIIVRVYYGGNESVEALLTTQCGKGRAFYNLDRKTVNKGWVEFEINAAAHQLEGSTLTAFRITFTPSDGTFNKAFDVYLKEITSYGWSR